MHQNLYNPIKVEEFAFLCNMSLSTFQRKFKQTYGISPAKYIEQQRIEKAKLLLIKTNNTISSISFQLGYDTLSHFSKVFKKNNNISSSEFRKNLRNQSI